MKINPHFIKSAIGPMLRNVSVVLAVVGLMAGGAEADKKAAAAPAAKPTNAPVAAVAMQAPKAEFVPGGRDPFYPESRRVRTAPAVVTVPGQPEVVRPVIKRNPYDYLKITGLIYSVRRPLVSINNVEFRPDGKDDVVVMIPDEKDVPQAQTVKVHCLEIKRKSAIIQVEGQPAPKELFWLE